MSLHDSPTLKKILKNDLCSGCGLCAGIAPDAIDMIVQKPGYSRPQQSAPLSDKQESLIQLSCPGSKIAPWEKTKQTDTFWGPWLQSLTGYATDPDVRYQGSSGGAISALLIHALDSGLVDQVIHVTADPANPTRNLLCYSTTKDEILANAGSRYAASSPLSDIERILSGNKKTAFVGKPCDVSALKQLSTVDARVNDMIPLTISFFCGGLPSHDGADRIIEGMGLSPADVVSFRYRGQGWPGKALAITKDGKRGEMSYADSWGGHLSKEVQFRCKICPDAVGGNADIACADAWYGDDKGYPSFEEQDGRSLILVRTPNGQRIINSASQDNIIETKPVAIRDIDRMQPSQKRRKQLILARIKACHTMLEDTPEMRGLLVIDAFKSSRKIDSIKNYLGTIRRIIINKK